MATTLECLLHPFDCAAASDAARTAGAVAGATAGATGGTVAGAEQRAGDIVTEATGPLHEIANTSMWITIGVVAASIVVLTIVLYIIYRVELA